MSLLAQLLQRGEFDISAPPTPDELRAELAALPPREGAVWAGFVQEIDPKDFGDVPVPGKVPTLWVLMRPEGPEASHVEVADTPQEAQKLLLEAMLIPPPGGESYRPAALYVPDAQQAFALGNLLRGSEVQVAVEPTGDLKTVRQQVLDDLSRIAEEREKVMLPVPVLAGLGDEAVREYAEAFGDFMRYAAWRVLPSDKPLHAEWRGPDGERHGVYATVMGSSGESFGLALFGDWLEYSEQLNSSFDQELMLRGIGGMEAVSEGTERELHPDDWSILARLKLLRGRGKGRTAPSLQRLSLNGMQAPSTPVHVVTAMLRVLADRAAQKPGQQATSLRSDWQGVRVRYPGKPVHELRPEELNGTVKLRLRGGRMLESGEVLTITGPSGETMARMRRELRKTVSRRERELIPFRLTRPVLMDEPEPGHFALADDLRVWEQGPGLPGATLAQFTRRSGLEFFGARLEVEFLPEPCEGFSLTLSILHLTSR